jgi:hypothetical protein
MAKTDAPLPDNNTPKAPAALSLSANRPRSGYFLNTVSSSEFRKHADAKVMSPFSSAKAALLKISSKEVNPVLYRA